MRMSKASFDAPVAVVTGQTMRYAFVPSPALYGVPCDLHQHPSPPYG